MWAGFAMGAKRLHDRDRTGWWLVVPSVISLLTAVLGFEAFLIAIGGSLIDLGTIK